MKMTTQNSPPSRNKAKPGTFAFAAANTSAKNTELISLQELSKLTGSFDDIVIEIVKKIEAKPGLESKSQEVCRDLERTFDYELPGVKARLFGSTVTGLAFKESDLDIFMECPNGQPSYDFVAKNSHIMTEQENLYTDVVSVSHTRAPIFKFTHVKTGLFCDVAFNDKIGLYHCDLVRFLLTLDVRLRPLFMIIKYWGFYHGVTQSGNLPNFALIMMIIFYLQQLKDPILPSIKFLQDLVKGDKAIIAGWNCSFCDEMKRIPENKNKLKLQTLLYGFFDYYSRFNYKDHIVCPFLGKLVKKSHFLEQGDGIGYNETLPDEFNYYKEYCRKYPSGTRFTVDSNSLCVQDPFNLSFNITKITADKHIVRFFWLCGYSCEFIFKRKSLNIFRDLYSPPVIDEPKDLLLVEKFKKDIYVYSVPLIQNNLQESERLSESYKNDWMKFMKESILLIFEDVLKFKISVNFESNQHCYEESFSYLSFDCHGVYPVYKNRGKIRSILRLQNSDSIKSEICISNYVKDNYQDTWYYLDAHFNMTFHLDEESPRATMSLFDTSVLKFNTFTDFAKHFNTSLEGLCALAFKHIAVNGFCKLPSFESQYRPSTSGSSQSDYVPCEQKASLSSISSTDTSGCKSVKIRKKKRK